METGRTASRECASRPMRFPLVTASYKLHPNAYQFPKEDTKLTKFKSINIQPFVAFVISVVRYLLIELPIQHDWNGPPFYI
jgi:hypothetical protein